MTVSSYDPTQYSSVRTSVNRLLRLADLLRELDRKSFDMRSWTSNLDDEHMTPKKNKCGMVCCLGGWAAAVHPDLELHRGVLTHLQSDSIYGLAFQDAFGLNGVTVEHLTSGSGSHTTPKAAAKAVERVAVALATENNLEIV